MPDSRTITNIFVLGEDPFNEQHQLRPLSRAYGFNFRALTALEESRVEHQPVLQTLEVARKRLACFDGAIDGLMSFFDFPVSLIAPILCREFGLPSPSVKSVLQCEHKYWSRLMQSEAAPEVVPLFSKLDPQEDSDKAWSRLTDDGIRPPFWIKPAKGVLGQLAYRIESREQLHSAMQESRDRIECFAQPLRDLLGYVHAELPDGLDRDTAARLFVVEEDVEVPYACTVEGHRFQGETRIHGIVDAFRYPGSMAFHRLQYPSKLPPRVQKRMEEASAKIMERIEYDGGAFNIEYFWNPQNDRISLLEINPRISQSHAPQFRLVDSDANMKIIADLAMGRKPHMGHGEGTYRIAAKLMLRVFAEDGMVTSTPGEADCEAVRQRFPEALITSNVTFGQHLSEQRHIDNYSWQLAQLYMGARNEEELLTHFNEAVEMLDFRVAGVEIDMPSPRELIIDTQRH